MKRFLALLLTLALTAGTALAENAQINGFLVRFFTLLGETDPDRQTLYAEAGGAGSLQLMKQDGTARLVLTAQGREYLIESGPGAIGFRQEAGPGYRIASDNVYPVLGGAVALLSTYTGVQLDKLSDADRVNLRACVRELLNMLLEQGLRAEAADGRFTLTLRLTGEQAAQTACAWADGIVRDPARLGAWQRLAKIADAGLGVAFDHAPAVVSALGDGAVPALNAFLPPARTAAQWLAGLKPETWSEQRAEMEAFLTPADPSQPLVHAVLSLTEAGDFDTFTLYRSDGTVRLTVAYEGETLVIDPQLPGIQVRVSAASADALKVSVGSPFIPGLRREGTLRLTEADTWQLTFTLDSGSVPFAMGSRPAEPFTPLAEQDDVTEITVTNLQTVLGFSI